MDKENYQLFVGEQNVEGNIVGCKYVKKSSGTVYLPIIY